MKKSTAFFLSFLILFSMAIASVDAQSKALVTPEERDYWNLGVGYDAKNNSYTAYALDMKTLQTISDTQANRNNLHYLIVEDKYNLTDSTFVGVDLGLSVSTPFVDVKASASMDIFNSIQTSQHSLSMVITFEHVKESLDVINADFSEAARTYYLANRKEAFIAKYGDRYLDRIEVGGKLNFVYRLSVSENSKIDKFKLKAACEVIYGRVFQGNAQVEVETISEEELSSIVKEVDVFYNGLPWRAEVKDYEDYCDLRDKFLEWLSTNSVVVNKKYIKYNELEFSDNLFYSTLNEWYRLREMVNAANKKAQSERNWDMETKCGEASYKINTVISLMKPDAIPNPPALSEYKEILDYLFADEGQIALTKAVPVGTVVSYMGDALNIPAGWILCDGSAVDQTIYNELYAVIGDSFKTTANAEEFNLPDLRGKFLRGLDTSGSIDPDGRNRKVGSSQADAFQGHRVRMSWIGIREAWRDTVDLDRWYRGSTGYANNDPVSKVATIESDGVNGTPRQANETRPKNMAVNFIIKY
jgi:hypothetical protein